VQVVPRSSRDQIVGLLPDNTLKVRLTAPPVDGAANDALVKLIAKTLKIPKRAIAILKGESSKRKILEISGVDKAIFPISAKE